MGFALVEGVLAMARVEWDDPLDAFQCKATIKSVFSDAVALRQARAVCPQAAELQGLEQSRQCCALVPSCIHCCQQLPEQGVVGGTCEDEEGMLVSMWSSAGRIQKIQLLGAELWIYLPVRCWWGQYIKDGLWLSTQHCAHVGIQHCC